MTKLSFLFLHIDWREEKKAKYHAEKDAKQQKIDVRRAERQQNELAAADFEVEAANSLTEQITSDRYVRNTRSLLIGGFEHLFLILGKFGLWYESNFAFDGLVLLKWCDFGFILVWFCLGF